jgi:hypothetical protein
MKLAEALKHRANAQTRLEQLRERLTDNALVQEGDQPSESPQELLRDMETTAAELTRYIQRINATNVSVRIAGGATLADALAEREVLHLRFTVYRAMAKAAVVRGERYSRSEVRFTPTVSVSDMHRKAEALAREWRELDAKIQEVNWTSELIEG